MLMQGVLSTVWRNARWQMHLGEGASPVKTDHAAGFSWSLRGALCYAACVARRGCDGASLPLHSRGTHVPMNIGTRLRHRRHADIRSSTRSGDTARGIAPSSPRSLVPLRYAVRYVHWTTAGYQGGMGTFGVSRAGCLTAGIGIGI